MKVTLSMLVVLAAALAVGGALLLTGNFSDSLAQAAGEAEAQHILQRYALESQLMSFVSDGEAIDEDNLSRYGATLSGYVGGDKLVALFLEPETGGPRTAFTTFPGKTQPRGDEDHYRVLREGRRTYLLFATTVTTFGRPYVTLLTGYDVTGVFTARSSSLWRFWQMELVVLVCAGVAVAVVSRWLTRPLARLTQASEAIAQGAYGQRTGITGADEIGQLSRSFDTMAQAVEERVDALELSVRQREDFMGAFTHELKTPMTSIIGFADTLRAMQIDPEEQRQAAGYIYSEARRVEKLSQKMLQLLRLADEPPTLAPVNLAKAAEAAARALTPAAAPVRVRISGPKDSWVQGDEDLLMDLIYNLAHNAVKAKPKDGAVHIRWRPGDKPDAVALTVRDDGCGIPADQLARVAEPFYMVDKSRARAAGGSGLGLALCRRIVSAHGGVLRIQSAPGTGTLVTVTLRRAQPPVREEGDERL